jgi:hypothetical protein
MLAREPSFKQLAKTLKTNFPRVGGIPVLGIYQPE